jgi:hypothetical protein
VCTELPAQVGSSVFKRVVKMSDEAGELEIIKGAELTDEMIAAQPERYRELANGAIYDNEAGHIVKAPPPEKQTITQANAREYHALAAQKRLEAQLAARAGIAGLVKTKSDLDAWQVINRKQGRLATMIEKGRSSTEAARFVGYATGFLSDDRTNNLANDGITVQIGADIARQLVELARQRRDDSIT